MRVPRVKHPEETTQEERKAHLRAIGWTEEQIESMGELPYHVLFLAKSEVTKKERAHALTITPSETGSSSRRRPKEPGRVMRPGDLTIDNIGLGGKRE